jgi:hypothetical protein
MPNLQLRYASPKASDERRCNVEVTLAAPFEFEGREWDPTSVNEEGFTLCIEHERTFIVKFEQSAYVYSCPRPEAGDVLLLEDGPPCSCTGRAPAHHDSRRGSFRAERI